LWRASGSSKGSGGRSEARSLMVARVDKDVFAVQRACSHMPGLWSEVPLPVACVRWVGDLFFCKLH
jgi:nitrite reductase/ring-hydroxylating ferredoxin subunit